MSDDTRMAGVGATLPVGCTGCLLRSPGCHYTPEQHYATPMPSWLHGSNIANSMDIRVTPDDGGGCSVMRIDIRIGCDGCSKVERQRMEWRADALRKILREDLGWEIGTAEGKNYCQECIGKVRP